MASTRLKPVTFYPLKVCFYQFNWFFFSLHSALLPSPMPFLALAPCTWFMWFQWPKTLWWPMRLPSNIYTFENCLLHFVLVINVFDCLADTNRPNNSDEHKNCIRRLLSTVIRIRSKRRNWYVWDSGERAGYIPIVLCTFHLCCLSQLQTRKDNTSSAVSICFKHISVHLIRWPTVDNDGWKGISSVGGQLCVKWHKIV